MSEQFDVLIDNRRKRAELITQAREIMSRAEKDKRAISSDEKEQYDGYWKEIEALGETIEREEQLREQERRVAEHSSQLTSGGQGGGEQAGQFEQRVAKIFGEERNSALIKHLVDDQIDHFDTPERRAAFLAFLKDDEKEGRNYSKEVRALSAGTDSEGGHTIAPTQFVAKLLKNVDDLVFIRRHATVTTLRNAKKATWPRLTADPADSDWTTELATGSEDSAMAFGNFELDPNPFAKRIKVSRTLLRQSTLSIESIVRSRLAYKFAVTEEKAYLTGNGSGKPLGIYVASASGIDTDRDLAFAATTAIDADTFVKAPFQLKDPYHARARWNLNRTILQDVAILKDQNDQYLWRPGLQIGRPNTISGFPYDMSEFTPATKTAGLYVGMLADFTALYQILDDLNLELVRLNELYAATNQIGIIGRKEGDGKPSTPEACVRLAMAAS